VRRRVYIEEEQPDWFDSSIHELVYVHQLPRETPEENRQAIKAWLQGMVDGTIKASGERRKALELSARLDGLLVNKSMKIDVRGELGERTIEELLSFGRQRSTLVVTTPEQLEEARRVSVSPPGVKDGKVRKNKNDMGGQ